MSSYSYSKRIFYKSLRLRNKYSSLPTSDLFSLIKKSTSVERFAAADVLRENGNDEIYDECISIVKNSKNFREREICAYILGKLKYLTHKHALSVLSDLEKVARTDKSSLVVASAILAMYAIHFKFLFPYTNFLPFLHDMSVTRSPNVRLAIVESLINSNIKEDICPLLEKLLADPVAKVRDWAGLVANISDCDTPPIRDALVIMLKDKREQGRIEAITALAKRRDPRVIPALREELAENNPLDDAIQAAAYLGDSQFIQVLKQLLERFDDSDGFIQSCLQHLTLKCGIST